MVGQMNEENGLPSVTIGVMVYNEEQYLKATLDSILQQAYGDCEILISDNASTDATAEIAQHYADLHPQIRLHRQPRNVGAILNFHTLVEKARGQYFVLAGAHDLWSPNYLSELVSVLEINDTAVMAYGRTIWIDSAAQPVGKRVSFVDTSDLNVVARFNITIWSNQHALYGMYRLDALRKCRTNMLMIGNGALLLAELALLGPSIVVPDVIWYRRAVRDVETREQRLNRYFVMLFPDDRVRLLPHWRIPIEHVRAVWRANLKPTAKLEALLCCGSVFVLHSRNMAADVYHLFRRAIRSVARRV